MRIANLVAVLAGLSLAGAAALTAADVAAAADGLGQPTPEYLAAKAELDKMVANRDLELFEVSFEPVKLDRLLLNDRLGKPQLFHYLVFRLRNQVGSGGMLSSQAKGYNDVLAAMAAQYEQAKVTKENGVGLVVQSAVPKDGVILERKDARTSERAIDLSVLAFNEHGTRLHLLDELTGNAKDGFNFPDLGQPIQGTPTEFVRDRVEEALNRKLLTTEEIRKRKLPAYDATKIGEFGWAEGEIYGVFVFNRLSDYGKHITIQVRGLSNKFRERWPDTEPGKVENYLEARFFRRQYVLHYEYPGDEFYRDLDRFTLAKSGWEWVPTFQRNSQRRTVAYSRYYLNNITSEKGDALNKPVEEDFWAMYNEARAAKADKLPDLQSELRASP